MSGAIPVYESPILGRQTEIDSLLGLLRQNDGGARLVTLTGPAGVGKTRLAAQVAGMWRRATGRRAAFASLASLDDPARLPAALAVALDLQDTGSMPVSAHLIEYLRDQRELILLDSFERLQGAGELLSQLLASSSRARFLVTSRSPLRIEGEVEFPVPPLVLPDLGNLPSTYVLSNYPAVSLFVQRAQAVEPSFTLTQANAAVVAEICVHLDGLPLAIELAAARIQSIPPAAMRERLQARLMLLIGGKRLPARHQSLRAAIDWSYDLLTQSQRTLFTRLAVFAGSSDAAAIDQVCNSDGDLPAVGQDLQALADQSLVQRLDQAGASRYALLETVQEYALERLAENGETASVRRAHALYFADLAEQAESQLRGPDQQRWLERWSTDLNNIRAALGWTLDAGEPEIGLRLASALQWFWYVRGLIGEGCDWLEKLLAGMPRLPSAARGRALNTLARLVVQQNIQAAQQYSDEALAVWQALDNPRGLADAYYSLGRTAANRGDPPARAAGFYAQSLQLYLDQDHKAGVADVWFAMGLAAANQGDSDRALMHYRQCLDLRREEGDTWGIARSLTSLAFTSADRYEFESARRYGDESLALYHQLGDRASAAALTLNLAYIEFQLGHYAEASRFGQEALAIWTDTGRRLRAVSAYYQLALVAIAESRYDDAQRLAEQGLNISQQVGFSRGLAWMQLALGHIALYREDFDGALRVVEECLALARKLEDKVNTAAALNAQAVALQRRGQAGAASAAIREGLQLLEGTGEKVGLLNLLESLAPTLAGDGRPLVAARLWAAAAAARAQLGIPLEPNRRAAYDRDLARARTAAGAEFEATWQTGQALGLNEAVSLALASLA